METKFQSRDPDFVAKVKASFSCQNVMQSLGISLHDVQAGFVELRMPFSEKLTQHHGFIHAGILTTALDSACGYAAFSLMDKEAEVLTVEFKTNFLAPAKGDAFIFKAKVLKSGKTLSISEAYAFAVSDSQEKMIASMNATLMAVYTNK